MARGRRLIRAMAAVALGIGMLTMPAVSAEQVPDPNLPHLPKPDNDFSPLVSAYASTLSYADPSKQWVQLVDSKVSAAVNIVVTTQTARCAAIFGDGSVRCVNERDDALSKLALSARAYPTNFVGDDPASPPADRSELRRLGSRFTDFPSQRVRLLAFGAVPAEATLHIGLVEDDGGLPIGIRLDADNYMLVGGVQEVTDTVGSEKVRVRLSNVTVDGRPVDVGEGCEVNEPGTLALLGRGYRSARISEVPAGRYNPNFGGLLQGTLSIGGFSNCGGEGDDISPLINAMAGNSELPVRIVQAEVSAICFTNVLRTEILESQCAETGKLDYPEGERLPALPPEFLPAPPVD